MMLAEIDVPYLQRQLKALLAISSPTGFTDEIARYVCKELQRLGVDFELTRRGAVRAYLAGDMKQSARGVVSHLDTLGAMVKDLKANGRLELVPIGHWSARFAEGARGIVYTDKGAYRGTILPLKASGHTFNEQVDEQPVGWEYVEMRVDALARNEADLVKLGINIGDIIAIDPQPEFLENGFIVSRHLDNKAGAATMLAALKSMKDAFSRPVDTYWLFTIAEEVGQGATSILLPDIVSLLTVDNGTTAPGQNSDEFGVTIAMADQTGPFDYHLTRKLLRLCHDHDIRCQRDVFRYYRSDSASAIEAGADVRTALATFGVDASHGYERIHMHALRSLAELICCYVMSDIEIPRDVRPTSDLTGFTHQPMNKAEQDLAPDIAEPAKVEE
jgi:peptidase M42 family hydrolase